MEVCQYSLSCKIEHHYPESAAGIQLFNTLAVFICTKPAYNGEEKNSRNRGQQHTYKGDAEQGDGGNYSGFQDKLLSFLIVTLNDNIQFFQTQY